MEHINLKIDKELITQAIQHSKDRMKYEYNRFGLSKDKRFSMILIGTIGQLIFKQFLESKNIDFKFEFQAGHYDDIDFKIKNKIIEIKTSGYSENYLSLNLLYSQDQLDRGLFKGYDYCVQIFINGYDRRTQLMDINQCNQAVISGYIEFNKIKNFKNFKQYYGDDYKVPLNNLKNILDLINL